MLHDAGLIGPDTVIATTVHPLQVLDEPLPTVTPEEVITCKPGRPRTGILWDRLPAEYLDAIPVLASLSPPSESP